MNNVVLVGRLTRDVDMRQAGETLIASFGVAVNRRFKNKEGRYDADFINCKAFGKTAEFIEKFFHKGDMISLNGNIQTGSYEKDGVRVYTTDVVVDNVEFCGGKSAGTETPAKPDSSFVNVPDGVEETLPFN